jgi:glycerol-3-phosphate dehydrogenase
MPGADFAAFESALGSDYPFLPASLRHHYARLYGTRARLLLEEKRSLDALGRHYGANFYEAEADFLRRTEWAMTPEDILFRRTKHHLHLSAREEAAAADQLARAA